MVGLCSQSLLICRRLMGLVDNVGKSLQILFDTLRNEL